MKCRGSAVLADLHGTMLVVSAALTRSHCTLSPQPKGNSSNIISYFTGSMPMIRQYWTWGWITAAALLAGSFTAAHAGTQASAEARDGATPWVGESGVASYYGKALRGRRTASGTRFDQTALTAAHPWLPFGTRVRVTLGETGRSVVVVITDRLYSVRRIVDLSLGAARHLGIVHQGLATVSLAPA
jgi:rare lipoprotein A